MKGRLAMGLACLAFLGSGCDAVFGEARNVQGSLTFKNAVSGDSGENPGGTFTIETDSQRVTLDVTCMKVGGGLAAVGGGGPRVGVEVLIDDRPGVGDDRFVGTSLLGTPDCAEPLQSVSDLYRVDSGDLHVIDDFRP